MLSKVDKDEIKKNEEVLWRIGEEWRLLTNASFDECYITIQEISDSLNIPIEIVRDDISQMQLFSISDRNYGFLLERIEGYEVKKDALEEDKIRIQTINKNIEDIDTIIEEIDLLKVQKKLEEENGIAEKGTEKKYKEKEIEELKKKIKKKFKSGDMDAVGMQTSFETMDGNSVVLLRSKEFQALRKFLVEHLLDEGKQSAKNRADRLLGIQSEELYKVQKGYNSTSMEERKNAKIIADAIFDNKSIQFSYRAIGEKTSLIDKMVLPLKLIQNQRYGMMYAITIENDKLFAYRLDRMSRVKVANNDIQIVNKDLLGVIPYMWGVDIGSELREVSFKVYNDNAGRVIDKVKRDLKSYIEEANYQIEESEDGIIVTGKVYGINSFKSWVRSYGASVIVLSPKEIVDEMIDSVMKKRALYE